MKKTAAEETKKVLTPEEIAEKAERAAKFEKEWLQQSSKEEAKDYFDNARASIQRMLSELDRYENRFNEFVAKENYYDACNCLEWTALCLQQHNPHSERAVRAGMKLALAFNVKRI
jgi:hypothetical protein